MMSLARRLLATGLLLPLSVLPLVGASIARADFPNSHPYAPIRYEHRVGKDPARQIFIARVDLTYPTIDVRVSRGGPDPDGDGEWQTTLQAPSVIAEREHFELAVNADFFAAQKTVDVEGANSGFIAGKWAKVSGPAMTDGHVWGPATTARPALLLDALNRAHIAMTKEIPVGMTQVAAGSTIILQNGKTVAETESVFSRTQHPRTAVGIANNGKTLILVVVDGRRPATSVGMSLLELAELMRGLGCLDALNLDGGGSSEMVMRDPQSGQLRVMNNPSDGRERAVGNVLGISVRGSRRTPTIVPIPLVPVVSTPAASTTLPPTAPPSVVPTPESVK